MESAGKFWRISVSKGVCRGVSVSDGSLVAHVLDRSSGLCEQKFWLVILHARAIKVLQFPNSHPFGVSVLAGSFPVEHGPAQVRHVGRG